MALKPPPTFGQLSLVFWLRSVAHVAIALAVAAYAASAIRADRRDHALCVERTGYPCQALRVEVRP